jgi:hypothetical protein
MEPSDGTSRSYAVFRRGIVCEDGRLDEARVDLVQRRDGEYRQ